jgi:rRNA maturation endonuclease Nob1
VKGIGFLTGGFVSGVFSTPSDRWRIDRRRKMNLQVCTECNRTYTYLGPDELDICPHCGTDNCHDIAPDTDEAEDDYED